MELDTYHIHINGIVQGVGFRPMVYQLANELQLNGYVKNGSDGVHVVFNGTAELAELVLKKIVKQAPGQSKIISSGLHKINNRSFTDFSIVVEDEDRFKKQVLISPDLSICKDCQNELQDVTNRRYRYPFITCTQCGPRYSIIESIPYERQNTAMDNFDMCDTCIGEYENISDRRFFSQTNSCPQCNIGFNIWEKDKDVLPIKSEEALLNIKNFLQQGKILAVKGIGGYLLLCDAADEKVIQLLRNRKHRPSKPFAVLYPGIEKVLEDFEVNKQEQFLLESAEAPIVLLYPKKNIADTLAIESIAPGLKRLGIMLPYSPLLYLVVNDFGKPLIATSANISGSPIIYNDEDALNFLFEIADYIIDYDRPIVIPQDESVVQVSKYTNQPIILRRSRGYAPSFLQYQPQIAVTALSTGAFLKSSFTLSVNGNVFVSQFLGSGESYESQEMYKNTLAHWFRLYSVKPAVIITDKHPHYFSHQYAIELSEKYQSEIVFVQHHKAHFAAVLAENNLLHTSEPVLGVIWDGTGLGDDGNIWGGEFFKYLNNEMIRCSHLSYFPSIAGDKPALEPRIAALCATGSNTEVLRGKFTDTEWKNYQRLIQNTTLFSSSMGRIFDAVASLLDICDKQTYEGEAAMYLQALAEAYVDENGFVMKDSYFGEDMGSSIISTSSLINGIIRDIEKGEEMKYVAAKFHYSLVCLVDIIAKNNGIQKICFSGGVFQNALLVDWIQTAYSKKYELYFHQNLSPNDENISFGQLVYYDNNIGKTIEAENELKKSIPGHERILHKS